MAPEEARLGILSFMIDKPLPELNNSSRPGNPSAQKPF